MCRAVVQPHETSQLKTPSAELYDGQSTLEQAVMSAYNLQAFLRSVRVCSSLLAHACKLIRVFTSHIYFSPL